MDNMKDAGLVLCVCLTVALEMLHIYMSGIAIRVNSSQLTQFSGKKRGPSGKQKVAGLPPGPHLCVEVSLDPYESPPHSLLGLRHFK